MGSKVMSELTSRHSLLSFRVRAITIGLNFSWIVVGVLVIEAVRRGVLTEPPVRNATIGIAVVLTALNVIRWENVVMTFLGKILLWLWGAILLAALAAVLTLDELVPATLGLYLAVVVFVGIIGRLRTLFLITGVSIASYILIPMIGGYDRPIGSLVVPVVAVMAVAVVTRLVTVALIQSLQKVARQQDEITRQEVNFERLYEVAQTISIGDSLDNVLPALVGRIGTFLGCEVGVFLVRDEAGASLNVVSPIWASGHSLEVAGYRIGLQTRDPLVEAFITQQPKIMTNIVDDPDRQGILGELGLGNVMVVSLAVDGKAAGLMVMGDKTEGDFSDEDLTDFVALAAPAALVLSQLQRYSSAAASSRKMEQLARIKTDFMSIVSHELRTPLTSIIGSLATLARPELAPEKESARDLLDSARSQTDRLRRLIEDLLMVSQIENRALPQHPVPVDLDSLMADVVAEIPGVEDRVTIEVQDRIRIIEADSDHLHRIMINLVQNAIKYAPGSPVEVAATPRAGGQVSISVADHGRGISEAQHQAVFDRFTQLDKTMTRSRGGTGLGLSIVKGLVEAMGGQIEIHETPGGGAIFNVILPRSPGSLPTSSTQVVG